MEFLQKRICNTTDSQSSAIKGEECSGFMRLLPTGRGIPLRPENFSSYKREKTGKFQRDRYIPLLFENPGSYRREKTEKPKPDRYNFLKPTLPSGRNTGNQGFVVLLLLPFTALMITVILGVSSLSLGIKNITRSQSHCIQKNLNRQKELGLVLEKILKLNNKVLLLHKTKKTIELSIAAAVFSGALHTLPSLNKKRELIKKAQKALILRQNQLLIKSLLIKRKAFHSFKNQLKKFNIFHVSETGLYKKALALQKKKVGDTAYTYKPVPDFINHQKSEFYWKFQPFWPLDEALRWIFPEKSNSLSKYSCTASLKQKGKQWTSTLYH